MERPLEAWTGLLPDHEVLEVLKVQPPPGGRVVLRTRFRGVAAVTRIVAMESALSPWVDGMVRELAVRGRGTATGLPEDATLVLEGYRSAARVRDAAGLPEILDAGVLEATDAGCGLLPPGLGRLYVTAAWVEGTPLDRAWPGLDPEARGRVLRRVLERLEALHAGLVAYGDLKPANVIVGSDDAWLIDLDTMREVAAPEMPAVTRDLTPRFAAPEQRAMNLTFLASDLYAYGAMASLLLGGVAPGDPTFPPVLPPPWGRVVAACLRGEPLARPSAGMVGRVVAGEDEPLGRWDGSFHPEDDLLGGAATERVDLPQVPPVPPPGGESTEPTRGTVPAPRPAAAVARRWLWGMLWAGAAAVSLAVLGALAALGLRLHAVGEADALARQVAEDLRIHKIEREQNTMGRLGEILADAEAARAVAETPHTLGVHALAHTWHQRWHWNNARWDAEAFALGDAVTREAVDRPTVEAWLARGILAGAACRLQPTGAEGRSGWCAESRKRLAQAMDHAPAGAAADWLRLEITWAAEAVERRESNRAREEGRTAEAAARAEAAWGHCQAGRAWLDAAPVNGPELMEDCVVVAGLVGDLEGYLWWADRLLVADGATGTLHRRRATLLFSGPHPDCADLPRRSDGRLSPGEEEAPETFCWFMGMTAAGCGAEAIEQLPGRLRVGRSLPFVVASNPYPWKAAFSAAATAPRAVCLLGGVASR